MGWSYNKALLPSVVLHLCYSIYEPAGLPDLLRGKGRGWEEDKHWSETNLDLNSQPATYVRCKV